MTMDRPAPESVEIAPLFTGSGLPKTPAAVVANLARRRRDEGRAQSHARQAAQRLGQAPSPETCSKSVHLSLFFDGTNNNREADSREPRSTSNIARLYHASIDHTGPNSRAGTTPTHFRYYCPGVGTVFPDIAEYTPNNLGLIGARMGEARVNWGLTRLIDALRKVTGKDELDVAETLDLVDRMGTLWPLNNGKCNREDALRPLIDQLQAQLEERRSAQKKPQILALRLYLYGFSRGAAQARTFCNWLLELTRTSSPEGETVYRFAGLPISIEFLGLFDTVAAVGFADSVPFAAGHMGWADDSMRLPDEDTRLPEERQFLRRCVHLVSAHEQRASFPLDSIRRCDRNADGSLARHSRYRLTTREYVYPGMHSDVGGGYPAGDQGKAVEASLLLSQIALHHMYREAFVAGAPLKVQREVVPHDMDKAESRLLTMDDDSEREFLVAPLVISRFNAWQTQAADCAKGPLENVVERETELITGWRIARYHGGVDSTGFFRRIGAEDESDDVRAAKQRLHDHRHAELAQARDGVLLTRCEHRLAAGRAVAEGDCPGYSWWASRSLANPLDGYSVEGDIKLIGGLANYRALNTEKAYEPMLDKRQLQGGANEFSRDYRRKWGPNRDEVSGELLHTVSSVFTTALAGTVYLINEEDEAQQFDTIHLKGTAQFQRLFADGNARPGQEALVALFDDHVHDSRAWFMNSSALGPREPWTDYFRYRRVHFDHESNKSVMPLITASRVVGLGVAVGVVGLAISRRDPRLLLIPSAAIPLIRGKAVPAEAPKIRAFDPLTGITYPMMAGSDKLHVFTRQPGELLKQIAALPLPVPLSEATATTPELKSIFQAAEAARAEQAKPQPQEGPGLLEQGLALLDDAPTDAPAAKPGWLDQLAGAANKTGKAKKGLFS